MINTTITTITADQNCLALIIVVVLFNFALLFMSVKLIVNVVYALDKLPVHISSDFEVILTH